MLAEIQIALLKLIIKDIEDVARTPSGGPGTNQYSAVNPEGRHPQIVEGVITAVHTSFLERNLLSCGMIKTYQFVDFIDRHIFGVLTYAIGRST